MSEFRILAVLILTAVGCGMARAQTADSASARDSIPRFPAHQVEITAQRESGLATVAARGVEITSAGSLIHETGSPIAANALTAMSSSLEIRSYGPLGSIAVPSFRGLPAEYTTVYRDGIPLTNEQLGETDLGQLTLHGVSRIELIPASAAILLGSDAIGAAINLESEFSDTASLRLGSEQTGYAHGSGLPENEYYASLASHPADHLRIMANGSLTHSTGQFPFYQDLTHTYVLRENNAAALRSASLNAEYAAGVNTLLQFISNYFYADRGSPGTVTTPYRGASSLDERLHDEQGLAAVKLYHSASEWSGWAAADYQNQYEYFEGASEGIGDTATNKLYGLTASANTILNPWLTGYAGADYLHSQLIGTENALPNSSPVIGRNEVHAFGAIALGPMARLTIAPSLRAQYVSDISTFELLPQALLEYTVINNLTIGAAYSRSFHAPTLNDLYWKGLGNPNLKPELANNGEVDVEYSPLVSGIKPVLRGTYFYTRAQNEIVWLPPANGGEWRPVNVGVAESNGWEFTASGTLTIDRQTSLDISEGYTLLAAHNLTPGDTNYGKELLYSSPGRSLFTATIRREDWGSLAVVAHYRDREFSDAANTSEGILPAVATYDVTITTRDFSFEDIGFHCFLSVQNLTDASYEEALDYPLPGRSYRFSLELNYQ